MACGLSAELELELPGGLLDASGRRLARAMLRPLTGTEEDCLGSNPYMPSAVAVTSLLSACLSWLGGVAPSPDLVRSLLVGDRDFLMLQLRRITLGEEIRAVIHCTSCRAKMDVDFAVQDVPVEARPQSAADYTLNRGGREIRFRLPRGGDQEAVIDQTGANAAELLLQRCLLDDGGVPLSAEDRTAVSEAMGRLAPRIDLELNLECPECSHPFITPFDTTAFFLEEIRAGCKRLIRETHLLALYYHWSESEVLGLRRDRRRAYLALLSDELRPR